MHESNRWMAWMACLALLVPSAAHAGPKHGLPSAISPPAGLESVSNSPTANALLHRVVGGGSVHMVDAFLTPADIRSIDRHGQPRKNRFIVVLQPTDPAHAHPDARTFHAMVDQVRHHFLDRRAIAHANASMRAQGQQGKLLSVTHNHVLIDKPRCYALVVVGKYTFRDEHAPPPMNMLVAYVWLRDGHLIVVTAYGKGNGSNRAWLEKDVPAWLKTLSARS